jgi:DNA repair photolyase
MPDKSKSAKHVATPPGEPFDFWRQPAVIAENDFKYKSLSNWAFNISVGCSHACRFCYVPSASAIKQGPQLANYGVTDPDEQWGEYSLLRPWAEPKFLASLKKAEHTPVSELKPDGNRAVMFCTTTDPYQVFKAGTPAKTKLLNQSAEALVRQALEAIRDQSTLNVRILTRSPLARRDFNLFKSFGIRLVFGMSLPTLRNDLSKIYEPKAPAPSRRLQTLQEAKAAGLHVYVAVAPTYPECDEADLRATLTAINKLDPITIFHEPINIRAENVKRIEEHAKELGVKVNTAVFATRDAWREYALDSLNLVQRLAQELELEKHLHLWPDKQLGSEGSFLKLREKKRAGLKLTDYEKKRHIEQDHEIYEKQYRPWLEDKWHRISEWPGK